MRKILNKRRSLNRTYRDAIIKVGIRFLGGLLIIVQFTIGTPAQSKADFTCGQTITEDPVFTENLSCPPGTGSGIIIGASDITLDLGGYTLSGYSPGTGVLAAGYEGITIRNGTIDGFNDGVFLISTNQATVWFDSQICLRTARSSVNFLP